MTKKIENKDLENDNINDSCECNEDNCNCNDEIINELQKKLDEKTKEATTTFEALQRTMAEFDNWKKRSLKEKETQYNTMVSDIISNFLNIIDNLDKALENETTDEKFKDGIHLIKKQFKDVLAKYNVEEINCLNQKFNPTMHESINHIEDEKYGENEVVEVYKKGYKLGDKVIRYAMVKVAN